MRKRGRRSRRSAEVVQEVRERAMRERRPYQIVFEHEGIHASPAMYPYEKRDEFLKQLEQMRTPPPIGDSGGDCSARK